MKTSLIIISLIIGFMVGKSEHKKPTPAIRTQSPNGSWMYEQDNRAAINEPPKTANAHIRKGY